MGSDLHLNYWGNTSEEEYYKTHNIKSTKTHFTSPRGLTLFTRSWLPALTPIRGIVFMIHGYGNDISWTFQGTPIFLARNGFGCFGLDLEGHGRSEGLKGIREGKINFYHLVSHLRNLLGESFTFESKTTQNIKATKCHFTSPRGLFLSTRSWLPLFSQPRGIVFMIHGYGNDISWTFQGTPIFLARNGFASFALDLEGNGRSEGLKGFVPNLDLVIDDLISFFDSIITQNPEFINLPKFLFGESMGGAICLLLSLRNANPDFFKGAILIAPMCKISDKVKPKWPVPEILTLVAKFAPTLAIVPTADLLDKSVKVPEKKIIGGMNPVRYLGKPRLGTVVELLRVTDYLNKKLGDVEIPFVVLHGSADVVTDPEVSKELYEVAKSSDKTIKIYEGMMHSLLFGETDENIEVVRSDILSWLNDRC